MVYGIGIDIVDVKRIEEAIDRWGDKFSEKVFTPAELEYSHKKAYPYNSLAVRFAAKEAFIKAVKAGEYLPFTDIEVVNRDGGLPEVRLYGRAKTVFAEKVNNGIIHLSLSHDRGSGVASIVIEKNGTPIP